MSQDLELDMRMPKKPLEDPVRLDQETQLADVITHLADFICHLKEKE